MNFSKHSAKLGAITFAAVLMALAPTAASASSRLLYTQDGTGTMNTSTWQMEWTGQGIFSGADPAVSGDPVREVGFDSLTSNTLANAIPSADGTKIYYAYWTGSSYRIAVTTPQAGYSPIMQLLFKTRFIHQSGTLEGGATRIQVDEANDYIYWTNCYSGCRVLRKHISAAESDTPEVIATASNEIRGFALDATRCKLFWSENDKVYTAACDGTGSKTQLYQSQAAAGAFSAPTVSGVAVDPATQKIYFASWKSTAFVAPGDPPGAVVNSRIWVGNESGTQTQSVLYEDGSYNLTAPALGDGGRIYWGDPGDFSGTNGTVRAGWTDGRGSPESLYTGIQNLKAVGTVGAGAATPTEPPAAPSGFDVKPASLSTDSSPSVTVSGGILDGLTLQCKLDAGDWTDCTSTVSLTSLNGDNPLSDGSHTFSARYVASDGTEGTPAEYTWVLDATAPAPVTITSSPTGTTTVTSGRIDFTGEANAVFTCSVDGGTYTTCTSPLQLTGLSQGDHLVFIKQTDLAGNTSVEQAATWTVVERGAPRLLAKVGLRVNPRTKVTTLTLRASADRSAGANSVKWIEYASHPKRPDAKAVQNPTKIRAYATTVTLRAGEVAFWVRVKDTKGKWSGWYRTRFKPNAIGW